MKTNDVMVQVVSDPEYGIDAVLIEHRGCHKVSANIYRAVEAELTWTLFVNHKDPKEKDMVFRSHDLPGTLQESLEQFCEECNNVGIEPPDDITVYLETYNQDQIDDAEKNDAALRSVYYAGLR